MSFDSLLQQFGPDWHIRPPCISTPAMQEGFLDVTQPNQQSPLVVVQYQPDENTTLVIQRFNTAYFDFNEQEGAMIELPPACQAGRYSWSPQLSQRNYGLISSQSLRRDGFFGSTPPATPILVWPGLSYTGEVNIKECPLIVSEDSSFQVVLNINDLTKGLTIPEGYRRSFWCRVIGFALPTV